VQKGEEELEALEQSLARICSAAELSLQTVAFKLEEAEAAASAAAGR